MALAKVKEDLNQNPLIRYLWITTVILFGFFYYVQIFHGLADSWPTPGEIPDIHGITFLLLISYSIFIGSLLIFSFFEKPFEKFTSKGATFKLAGFHILMLLVSLVLPIGLFIMIYILAYFLWFAFSSYFSVAFSQEMALKICRPKIITEEQEESEETTENDGEEEKEAEIKLSPLYFFIFWLIGVGFFGFLYESGYIAMLEGEEAMIFLAFPLFFVLLPVIWLIRKPESGVRPPITAFGTILMLYIGITWAQYITRSEPEPILTGIEGILDIVLISFSFYTLIKNSATIEERTNGKLKHYQVMLPLIWSRFSSFIILLAVDEYTLFGYDAHEGTYLAGMFLMFVIGTVVGLAWLKRGVKLKDLERAITLPDIAGDTLRR